MKAIVQDRYGSADVLQLKDVDPPVFGESEVLVQVRAAGCGPDVWHLMTGLPRMARLSLGLRTPKSQILGWDVAGIVEAVGASVTDFKAGDAVMGVARGSFAEQAIASPARLALKPSNLSFEEAAAIPISGMTALQALRDVANVQSGQRVLIIGAAGGVGTLAVQIAKAYGAHVTGVCSTSKLELVRSVGADEVIDYTREDFADSEESWDIIVDTAGRRSLRHLRRALRPRGTLVVVGGDGGGPWTGGFFRGVLRAPFLALFVGQKLRGLTSKERAEDLVALRELLEGCQVRPVIDSVYPLAAAPDAIRHLANGHPAGKVVITVADFPRQ
jgi:NADPH:quinone reductase-like Zn-dependent oxidoreductase